jgi:RimJ/RimL family protein N-acetyltransferase
MHSTETGTPLHSGTPCEDTLDLRLPPEFRALFTDAVEAEPPAVRPGTVESLPFLAEADLLDSPAAWGPATLAEGTFQLAPVRLDRDLDLLARWMNDPAVDAFWELAGPAETTAAHLRAQLEGDGRSIPCMGLLDGTPMSYWEIYRADLDPVSRHYPARPHDTGIHLLIGDCTDRGRGLGTRLLRTVADLVLANRPRCTRVIAEPDIRNTPSVSAFLSSGFRLASEIDLPEKRAALMIRERSLRNLL